MSSAYVGTTVFFVSFDRSHVKRTSEIVPLPVHARQRPVPERLDPIYVGVSCAHAFYIF